MKIQLGVVGIDPQRVIAFLVEKHGPNTPISCVSVKSMQQAIYAASSSPMQEPAA